MKKLFIIIGVIVGIGIAYWLISPLFIDRKVNEKLEDIVPSSDAGMPQVMETLTIGQGSFTGLLGHHAEGTAKLIQLGERRFVRFEDDFKVTNGPDLFVYLGKNGAYDPNARLAPLKGNIGSQQYEIPPTMQIQNYTEVWVWCRSFSVPFGKAVLH